MKSHFHDATLAVSRKILLSKIFSGIFPSSKRKFSIFSSFSGEDWSSFAFLCFSINHKLCTITRRFIFIFWRIFRSFLGNMILRFHRVKGEWRVNLRLFCCCDFKALTNRMESSVEHLSAEVKTFDIPRLMNNLTRTFILIALNSSTKTSQTPKGLQRGLSQSAFYVKLNKFVGSTRQRLGWARNFTKLIGTCDSVEASRFSILASRRTRKEKNTSSRVCNTRFELAFLSVLIMRLRCRLHIPSKHRLLFSFRDSSTSKKVITKANLETLLTLRVGETFETKNLAGKVKKNCEPTGNIQSRVFDFSVAVFNFELQIQLLWPESIFLCHFLK
jgi:hypothetical protein